MQQDLLPANAPYDLEEVRRHCMQTTIITSRRLDEDLKTKVVLASETFQHTGSFKFRAAFGAALHSRADHLLAASSGNFGQALACAAAMLGKKCSIVMPEGAAATKKEAVLHYGAQLHLVDTARETRKAAVERLAAQIENVEVLSAYDDERVILGNSTLGEEIARIDDIDCVLVPVGGGGLLSGIIEGLRRQGKDIPVWGAEPKLANDGARSLRAGELLANSNEPATIADGARTISLGVRNFALIKEKAAGILEVEEESIARALVKLFHLANLKVEPTGALALAALLDHSEELAGKKLLLVLSGGNVDPANYSRLISG